MALSPVVSWVTLCALVLCIVSAFAAEEIVIVPTQVNDAYMLFQSSTEAGRSDTRPLLINNGGYSSGGAAVGSITYDFRHSLRLSRIELITDQIGTGLTTHRIESGYYSINTFIYEFSGSTSSGQVLSFTFPNNTMARMLRINTLKSMGGVSWSKVTVWGWSEQMVPTPPPAFNYRISGSSSDYGTYPDQLLFGTGAWSSGKIATTSSKVYVEYDFNQLSTRIDSIQLTCSQANQGTTSHRIMGGAPGSLKDLFLWTGFSKDNDVITIQMNGTQMRALRISTENSAGNIHGWKSIKVFTAKSNPGLLFEPSTWGTTYMGYKDTPYNVVAPPVAVRATVFAFGGGGGGNNITGNPGGGAYVAGNITNLNDLHFYVGGMGGTGAAGNGHNSFSGGEGGMSYSSSVSAGGGGGGGTFIRAGGNIIMVVGGGGGSGASFTVNNGGNGGHGGYFTASGSPIIGSGTRGQSNGGNFYFGGIGGQGGAYSTNTGQTGQSYGGGGGGGGYPGGLGGGTLNAQTVVAAGAGGGGASAILSPADFSGTFSSINLGGMPGAIQLVWEYTTIHFSKFSTWGPDVAMNCPIILSVVAGTLTSFPAPQIPVRFTIYGDTARFSDGSSVCDTLTTDAAYSCPIIASSAGTFRVAAQTPLSFSGGYLLYAENLNAIPGGVCAS